MCGDEGEGGTETGRGSGGEGRVVHTLAVAEFFEQKARKAVFHHRPRKRGRLRHASIRVNASMHMMRGRRPAHILSTLRSPCPFCCRLLRRHTWPCPSPPPPLHPHCISHANPRHHNHLFFFIPVQSALYPPTMTLAFAPSPLRFPLHPARHNLPSSASVPSQRRRRPRPPKGCLPPPNPKPRPDAEHAAFIPQTIEFALRQAHQATADALIAGHTHLRVELPMGRSRKNWYRMSPITASHDESCLLAFHFAELFKGLTIHLVLPQPCAGIHSVPWIHAVHLVHHHDLFSTLAVPPRPKEHRVVIFAALHDDHLPLIKQLVSINAQAVVLFNCLLQHPISHLLPPFTNVYITRALNKCAIFLNGHNAPWHVFVEIAIFEYEWVGDCDNEWRPSQRAVERFAVARNAQLRSINGYWRTPYAGCEAGFWPFMTIACREVLPIDGRVMAKAQEEELKKKKNKRPFGFF